MPDEDKTPLYTPQEASKAFLNSIYTPVDPDREYRNVTKNQTWADTFRRIRDQVFNKDNINLLTTYGATAIGIATVLSIFDAPVIFIGIIVTGIAAIGAVLFVNNTVNYSPPEYELNKIHGQNEQISHNLYLTLGIDPDRAQSLTKTITDYLAIQGVMSANGEFKPIPSHNNNHPISQDKVNQLIKDIEQKLFKDKDNGLSINEKFVGHMQDVVKARIVPARSDASKATENKKQKKEVRDLTQ